MSFEKPFHRNYRPVKQGPNSGYSDWAYIRDNNYCLNPEHYTRAFSIIQEDILKLFQYIEPSEINCSTYSFRIHELLMRICIEVETNFKAILSENIFTPVYKNGKNKGKNRQKNKWNINDFKKINKTHHLDAYIVELPFWKGDKNIRKPFKNWELKEELSWYQAYNNSKHDRINNFKDANFDNLIDAFTGLFVLLSSQFKTESFEPGHDVLVSGGSYFGGEFGIGTYLIVNFPNNWSDDEIYDFNWTNLVKEEVRFEKINYNEI